MMRSSRRFPLIKFWQSCRRPQLLVALLGLAALLSFGFSSTALAQGSGLPGNAQLAATGLGVSDMKLGSVLFYNYYTSDAASSVINTRFNIVNTSTSSAISVHLFFVDSNTCNVADSYICLTPNQTASFLASDIDPNVTGYMVAVAVDSQGRPVTFNFLGGDTLTVSGTGHRFGLAAVAAARRDGSFASPINSDGGSATMYFNGIQYDLLPFATMLDSFPSQTAGSGGVIGDTRLYVYTPLPDLTGGFAPSGTLFFLVRDDVENTFSGQLPLNCYLASDKQRITSVRTAPNINTIVPPGRTGWASFYGIASTDGARQLRVRRDALGNTITLTHMPLLGATATKVGPFFAGHNLRYVTVFNPGYSITIPVFPSNCIGTDFPTVNFPTMDSNL